MVKTIKEIWKSLDEKERKYLKLGLIFILIAGLLSIVIMPLLMTLPAYFNWIDYSNKGPVGDTINGIAGPFIALLVAILTFLAFYIQFKANKQQRELFQDELDEQREQFRKTQFENQFYEMVRLHKETVNELLIKQIIYTPGSDKKEYTENIITGRKVFDYLLKEFEVCFIVAKDCFPKDDYKVWTNEAYGAFFHGINEGHVNDHPFFDKLYKLKDKYQRVFYWNFTKIFPQSIPEATINLKDEFHYNIVDGHSSMLSHYYRHLFQTVKLVACQDEKFLSYEEKRKYLRILRGQLSNNEQVLLFYNWLSKFGRPWENETNKFLTDYRIIHNIYQALLLDDIPLHKIFDLEKNYRKEVNRPSDLLFEFQDWKN